MLTGAIVGLAWNVRAKWPWYSEAIQSSRWTGLCVCRGEGVMIRVERKGLQVVCVLAAQVREAMR